ncbi:MULTISPECIES: DUF262 domain-containing protein [unclassified Pseudomonas]|uniref:DUF262 domain-containing protein n=1 Tax=unclassified Pseudomonas TaxID=196821 RepID=UPI000C8826C4|nr:MULTISPECIES: DUF262 domain-containing protein [unclassified Pseudomonas]PMZ92912.1 hypothetical protein C1X79_19060 [Pseudomonas sp. FW305-42]PNA20772.1 hypothetical protein C1X78_20980 [Pseudomonas sp. MPR-R1B]PNB23549.1 hypothetical protein C1X80_18580 [Pseudomonas sp. DP16D-E2]PNB41328.1 hypothetical protein C1X75_20905 [Pseudomonas sp. FW305-17]PNB59467.1 hypothetical protein C1X77_15875 [Pseudomonas sp. GW531-E2]
MYKPGGTIKQLLDKVASQEYILPAIQREFVWWPEQICRLFDSLMQGYPFGTFLFWRIAPEKRQEYQFYDFVRDFHERDNYHCALLKALPERDLVAVLDGQQRMTALNIGLRGSYAWKLPGKWWSSNDAFPIRHLYLDLLGEPDVETGSEYRFEFLTETVTELTGEGQLWLRVSRVLVESEDDLIDSLDELDLSAEQRRQAKKVLRHLYRTVHHKELISYYEEAEQDLGRVLNIFIRMNSGGTPLSYSDLLLSIAVAQWSKLDARQEIHQLVDQMNKEGDQFNFSKDLVLKAGLMLSDIGSVGFKVENFNKANMELLEENWSRIREALLLSVRLLASFGFNSQNLRADSALLPIAYYLFARQPGEAYLSRAEYAQDRENVRKWLIRSLLKASGIWGSGLDTLLTALRDQICTHAQTGFPVSQIESVMSARGKTLSFTEEELDELVELPYGDKRTFALLSLIFPGFDLSRHFHVDHIYPQARFTKPQLRKADIPEDLVAEVADKANRLANLQLLEGSINNQKRQKMPHDWYAQFKPDALVRQQYLMGLEITDLPETLADFPAFYEQRRKALRGRIVSALQ